MSLYIPENAFENVVYEMLAILSRPQCVKMVRVLVAYLKSPYLAK